MKRETNIIKIEGLDLDQKKGKEVSMISEVN